MEGEQLAMIEDPMPVTDGAAGEPEQEESFDFDALRRRWQHFIKIGNNELDKFKDPNKRADMLMQGELIDSRNVDGIDGIGRGRTRYNAIRPRVIRSVNNLYARNPKVTATTKKPFYKTELAPMIDPATGQPVIGADGMPVMVPNEIEISEERADIVEAVMNESFRESSFKSEAKAGIYEAKQRPCGWLEVGYEFDEDNDQDGIFYRFRRFTEVISDPLAEFYHGVVRNCRFMGRRLCLSESEAGKLGLDWAVIKSNPDNLENDALDSELKRGVVYEMWDKDQGLYGYVCEHGQDFPKPPEPWPLVIDGFPFVPLKLAEDQGKKFSRPPVLEAEYHQEEITNMRQTMNRAIVHGRPVTLYDSIALSKTDVAILQGREKEGYFGVENLGRLNQPPMVTVNDNKIDPELYGQYARNEYEMDVLLGVISQDTGRASKASATEIDVIAGSSEQFVSAEKDVIDDWMRTIARKAKQILEQTITDEKIIEVTGRDGVKFWAKYTGSVLQECDVDIEVGSTTRQDDNAKQQVNINLLNVAKGVPGIDTTEMVLDTMKDMGRRNVDKYRLQAPTQGAQPQPGLAPGGAAGETTGINPAQSLADQMNPMV